jgi:type I restriction enzyme S subunit
MMGGGAIFASVTKNDMLKVKLVFPSDSLLAEYEFIAAKCDTAIVSLYRQNVILKEARDILLPRLMTGMIDIEQVELPEALLERINNENDNN